MLRHTGMCCPNELLFHQKSLNMGPILVKKILTGALNDILTRAIIPCSYSYTNNNDNFFVLFSSATSTFMTNPMAQAPGGYFEKNCTWMCLLDLEIWLSLNLFLSPFTTHQFSNFVQNHSIYVNWVPSPQGVKSSLSSKPITGSFWAGLATF